MAERSHLSIGEVLSLLREEFPDVTISKIRFLESQGLVDPERTPSGYRKFYEHDVERLRWILRQQRENFLPLKVIRGRLSEQERDDTSEEPAHATTSTREVDVGSQEPATPVSEHASVPEKEQSVPERAPSPIPSLFAGLHAEPAGGERRPTGADGQPGSVGSAAAGAGNERRDHPAGWAGAPQTEPAQNGPTQGGQTPAPGAAAPGSGARGEEETYTAEELANAAGGDAALVGDLGQYGLISPHAVVGGTPYYDESALAIARAAVSFSHHGVEVRHLKVWRNAAEREADLFQQVVLPLLRQRNPQARQQAFDTLARLTAAGAELRAALVQRAVREIR